MSSKKILRGISLVMFVIAAIYVGIAITHPEMGNSFYIGKFQVHAGHWLIAYLMYIIVMVALFVMSFTKLSVIIAVNIAMTLLVLGGNVFYQMMGMAYPIKLICSGGFMLMGIMNLLYAMKTKCKNLKLMVIMAIAMIFAFLGDFAINQEFVSGVIFFALGHVFFVVAFLLYRKITKPDIVISSIWGVISVALILLCPLFVFEPSFFRYISAVYAGIISLMVGKALGNAIAEKSFYTKVIGVGSLLFYFSDVSLVFAWFSVIEERWISHLCMALYYPALVLMGWSMVIYILDKRKEL